MSRYELERFEPKPDPDLICSICQSVLDKPLQTKCSHVFCQICIETWLTNRQTCPNCRNASKKRDLKPVLPILRNLLNRLKVHCKYYQYGCKTLFVMEFVLSHESSCEFEPVPCCYAKCTATGITRKNKSDHEKDCEFREVQCKETCGLMILVKDKEHDCLLALKAHVAEQQSELNRLRARAKELEELKTSLEGQLSQVQRQLNDRDRISDLSDDDWPTISSSDDDRLRNISDTDDNVDNDSVRYGRALSPYHLSSSPAISNDDNADHVDSDQDAQSFTASTPEYRHSPQTSHVSLSPNSPRSPERTPSLSPSHYSRSAEPTPVPSPCPDIFEDVPSSPGASPTPAFSPAWVPAFSGDENNGSDNDHSRIANCGSNSDFSSAREYEREDQNIDSEGGESPEVDNEIDDQNHFDDEDEQHHDSDSRSTNYEPESEQREFPCYNSSSDTHEEEDQEDSTTVTSGSNDHDYDNNEDSDSTLGDRNHDNRWSGSENSKSAYSGSRTSVDSDNDDRSYQSYSDSEQDSSQEDRNTGSNSDCHDRDGGNGFDTKDSDEDEDSDFCSKDSRQNKEKRKKKKVPTATLR